jgi:hypothetical protein
MCKTRIEDVGLVIDIGSKSGRLRIVFFGGGGLGVDVYLKCLEIVSK